MANRRRGVPLTSKTSFVAPESLKGDSVTDAFQIRPWSLENQPWRPATRTTSFRKVMERVDGLTRFSMSFAGPFQTRSKLVHYKSKIGKSEGLLCIRRVVAAVRALVLDLVEIPEVGATSSSSEKVESAPRLEADLGRWLLMDAAGWRPGVTLLT